MNKIDEDIDIFEAIITIWRNKFKVLTVTVITLVVSLFLFDKENEIPKTLVTTEIRPISTFDEIEYDTYNAYLSQINSKSIDYINVHGTSTPLGDLAEINAIINVFKDHAYSLEISATKSMTGHLLGAAGAIESIICIKSINENYIPPTINNKTLDSKINPKLNLNLNKGKEKKTNTAICNTFGFGGHNTSVIFKKYTD